MDGNMNNQQYNNTAFPEQGAGFQDPNAGMNNMNQQAPGFASTGYYDPNAAYQQPGFQTAGFQTSPEWAAQSAGGAQSKKGIPAMICGICAVAFFWLGFTAAFFVPVACGIVGIVLGSQAIKANGKDTKGRVGVICGIIGVVIPVLIFIIACAVGIASVASNY